MIVLDENIQDGQRLLLQAWRLTVRQIGVDLGHKGLKDEEIVVLLRQRRKFTFFTRDVRFYQPAPASSKLLPGCGECWAE